MDRRTHDGPSYPQRTVVGSIAKALAPCPNGRTNVTNHRTHDGPSCTTVLVARDPVSKGLSLFPSVLQRTHVTDRHTHDGPSCMTVIAVRDLPPKGLHFFPKCPTMDIYTDRCNCDGPSCTHRHASQRLSFRVLYLYIVEVKHDGPHDGPS